MYINVKNALNATWKQAEKKSGQLRQVEAVNNRQNIMFQT